VPVPYYRYKPEPMMGSTNVILYWDVSIITDKTKDFNRHDIVLIERQNKTALLTDTAVPKSGEKSSTNTDVTHSEQIPINAS